MLAYTKTQTCHPQIQPLTKEDRTHLFKILYKLTKSSNLYSTPVNSPNLDCIKRSLCLRFGHTQIIDKLPLTFLFPNATPFLLVKALFGSTSHCFSMLHVEVVHLKSPFILLVSYQLLSLFGLSQPQNFFWGGRGTSYRISPYSCIILYNCISLFI